MNSSRRTIIINGFKPNILFPAPSNPLTICTIDAIDADVNDTETPKKGRKRSLEHLSFEEKLLRKKLKNREAAQSSRDRKKARMDELEKTVKLLGKCNKQLSSRIEKLQTEKKELHEENDRLREEIQCLRDGCSLESKTGSAESIVFPLPKGHSRLPLTSSNPLLIQVVFLQMITFIGFLRIAITISPILTNWSKTSSPNLRTQKITISSSTRWWGRHQRCWNPVDRNQNHHRIVLIH